jgi:cation diffusion facilitator family transporter
MSDLKDNTSTKTRAIRLSLIVVICLIILKVTVSIISNSVSIAAQAADSMLDLFSIGITYAAVRFSSTPPDEKHPFGHGKVEGLAALVQAALILGAGGYIIFSAIRRIILSAPIQADEGMAVMGISILASFLLSRYLRRVARATDSLAIEASARNISADVYSAAGVLGGLLLVRFTGLVILDPLIALIMAGFVLKAGCQVISGAFHELTDYTLPEEEQSIIKNTIREHDTRLVSFHAVRSRRAGSERFVDLHLVVPRGLNIEEAHSISDHLELDIKERLRNASVVIHIEPCVYEDCTECSIIACGLRSSAQRGQDIRPDTDQSSEKQARE